jgi:hypothetical protein
MIIDPDHMDHLLFSEQGIPHAYVPDHAVNMAFLGSNTAGDWAVGDFWGPLGNETRAWLDHLATGAPTVHTTPSRPASISKPRSPSNGRCNQASQCACRCGGKSLQPTRINGRERQMNALAMRRSKSLS